MKHCCYQAFLGEPPDKYHCIDACENCNYFLDGSETKNITILIREVPITVNSNKLIEEIEKAVDVDIEFIEERMN